MTKSILTCAEIDAYEGIVKSHFLSDNAVRRNKSLGDLTGLSAIGFHIIGVQPGRESTELHKHYYEEECVYVLVEKHGPLNTQVYRRWPTTGP